MKTAPIALFVYNRPLHTRCVLEYLSKNIHAPDSTLYIFCDGPHPHASASEIKKIEEVRDVIRSGSWCGTVLIEESPVNKGIFAIMTEAMSRVVSRHGKMIVLEDDIVPSKYFLDYCNRSLDKYESRKDVMAISGYGFPLKSDLPETFFLRTGSGWGWATWQRAWEKFNPDSGQLLEELETRNQVREFNFNGTHYFYEILKGHHEGTLTAWDACWYATIFLDNGLTLYPARSLTKNIGMDGSGTHYKGTASAAPPDWSRLNSWFEKTGTPALSDAKEQDATAKAALEDYFRSINNPDFFTRVKNKIRKGFGD